MAGNRRGNGVDRGILEGGVLHAGGPLPDAVGERSTHQECAGAEDGRKRWSVDRAVVGMRTAAWELRAAAPDSGIAGSDSIPETAGGATNRRGVAAPRGSATGRDQIVVSRQQHIGGVWAGDVRGSSGRQARRQCDGRIGAWFAAGQTAFAAEGAGRALHGPSPGDGDPNVGPHRLSGGSDCEPKSGGGRKVETLSQATQLVENDSRVSEPDGGRCNQRDRGGHGPISE